MGEERKGRVVLQTQPSVEIERDIVDLLRQVEEGVTARDLVSRLRAVPAVLRENVSASDGKEIAKFFKELGADAVFVAYDRQESGALKGSAAGKRVTTFTSWRIFGLYLLLLLALGLCLAVGAYYVEKKSAPAPRPQGAAALEMDSAFLSQYALKPDSRFLNAFQFSNGNFNDFFKVFGAAPLERFESALAPLISLSMSRFELKGNFRNAAIWYQICRETMLQNNGEYHWATTELFWWSKLGLLNRHRLPSADVEAGIARDTVEAGAS